MILFSKLRQELDEKLIVFNGGKQDGQIVFMAGGSASGKGFAIDNFIDSRNFKIRDVDSWKEAFLKISQATGKHPELANFKMSNPRDVRALHDFVVSRGVKTKTLDMLLSDLSDDNRPNILFDITLKTIDDIAKVIPLLLNAGYSPKNIHIVWVLTNYDIAVKQNHGRERIVPDDIVLTSHEGAAVSMHSILQNGAPKGVDGKIAVILNSRQHTIHWDQLNSKGKKVIRDFKYFTVKKEGKPIVTNADFKKELYKWVKDSIPLTKATSDLYT